MAVGSAHPVHRVHLNDISSGSLSESTLETLREGLAGVGLVAVEIPEFTDLAQDMLVASSECAVATAEGVSSQSVYYFPDRTARHTVAAESGFSGEAEFDNAVYTSTACENFNLVQSEFQDSVNKAVNAFTNSLDAVVGGELRNLLLDMESGVHQRSLKEVVSSGSKIEHFHAYVSPSVQEKGKLDDTDFTLDMHVDNGLFIAMTPAQLVSETSDTINLAKDFFIQLETGEIVNPEFNSGDLVFMVGSGFENWLNGKLDLSLRSLPHAMTMPKALMDESVVRSWYGRMILPKSSVVINPDNVEVQTFGDVRRVLKAAASRSSSVSNEETLRSVCSDTTMIDLRMLQDTCAENEIYCWADCQSILPVQAGCEDDQEVICARPVEDENVECLPGQNHTTGFHDCVLVCHDNSTDTDTDDLEPTSQILENNGFCSGRPVSMFMEGFTGVNDADADCLVFFFRTWIMDTEGKFIAGSIGAVFFGIASELVVYVRQQATDKTIGTGEDLLKVFLYGLQQAMGYLAMFIAMTYSVILFIMIVVGLTAGHWLFNFSPTKKKETKTVGDAHVHKHDHEHKDAKAETDDEAKKLIDTEKEHSL